MRKKQEIKKGIAILRMKGDKISLLQAEVLENGHNESQVFVTYVASVPEEDKDETVFYACRDAARFAAGRLSLEELIPDADRYPVTVDRPEPKERQSVSVREFEALKRKVAQLEGFVERTPPTCRIPEIAGYEPCGLYRPERCYRAYRM